MLLSVNLHIFSFLRISYTIGKRNLKIFHLYRMYYLYHVKICPGYFMNELDTAPIILHFYLRIVYVFPHESAL